MDAIFLCCVLPYLTVRRLGHAVGQDEPVVQDEYFPVLLPVPPGYQVTLKASSLASCLPSALLQGPLLVIDQHAGKGA